MAALLASHSARRSAFLQLVRPHRLDADEEELIAPAATADDLDTCICAVAGYSRHRAIVNIGAADI